MESLFYLQLPLIQDQPDQPKEPVCSSLLIILCLYSYLIFYIYLASCNPVICPFPYQPDPDDFCEEQWLMAKLIHLFKAEVADQQYMVGIIWFIFIPIMIVFRC